MKNFVALIMIALLVAAIFIGCGSSKMTLEPLEPIDYVDVEDSSLESSGEVTEEVITDSPAEQRQERQGRRREEALRWLEENEENKEEE